MLTGINIDYGRLAQRERHVHLLALAGQMRPALVRSPSLAGPQQYALLVEFLEAARAGSTYPTLVLISKPDPEDATRINTHLLDTAQQHLPIDLMRSTNDVPLILSGDNEPEVLTQAQADALVARTAHLCDVAAERGLPTLGPGLSFDGSKYSRDVSMVFDARLTYLDVRLYPSRTGGAAAMLANRVARNVRHYANPNVGIIVTEYGGGETVDDGHGKPPVTEAEQSARLQDCLTAMGAWVTMHGGCVFEGIDEGLPTEAQPRTRNWGLLRQDGAPKPALGLYTVDLV
jgi:hypothetical protein